jgi:hypothetical protein
LSSRDWWLAANTPSAPSIRLSRKGSYREDRCKCQSGRAGASGQVTAERM